MTFVPGASRRCTHPRVALLVSVFVVWCSGSGAQPKDPAHLADFPSVERVRAEIAGSNERDTALRQVGALYRIRRIMEELSDGRDIAGDLTPDERRLKKAYDDARIAIQTPYEVADAPDRSGWIRDRDRLYRNDDFRDELLERFFTPQWADAYLAKTAADRQRTRRAFGPDSSIEFELPAAERRALLLQLAAAALLVGLALWRETRSFGPDALDPRHVRAGLGRGYVVNSVTGRVSGVRHHEHEVERTNKDTHETTRWKEQTVSFSLEGHSFGKRRLYMGELVDGARMSLAWLGKPKNRRYYLFMNHEQGAPHVDSAVVRKLVKPWLWPIAALLWLIWTAFLMSAYWAEGGDTPRGSMLVASAALVFLFYLWRNWIAKRRTARVLATIAGPPLLETLNAQAAAINVEPRTAHEARRGKKKRDQTD